MNPAATPQLIETEALIIGAGPAALFLAFQLGLQEIACHLIDVLPAPGGQCHALYPDKPIYDLPGLPVCSGRELTERLLQQLRPFNPPLHLGQLVSGLQRRPDGRWHLRSIDRGDSGQEWIAPLVFIAAGVGAFLPRKEALAGLERFERGPAPQVCYHDLPAAYTAEAMDKRHIVVHGGDAAAVELALELAQAQSCLRHHRNPEHTPAATVASRVASTAAEAQEAAPEPARCRITLLHRSPRFQIEPALQTALGQALAQGRLRLVLGQPVGWVSGPASAVASPAGAAQAASQDFAQQQSLQALHLATPGDGHATLPCDLLLPRLGLSPKLGPLADWGLALERKHLPVDSATLATAEPGLFAVGDINHYPGKRKLIVCAFHESTLAAFAAAALLRPGQRQLLQYTTTSPRLQQLLGVAAQGGAAPNP